MTEQRKWWQCRTVVSLAAFALCGVWAIGCGDDDADAMSSSSAGSGGSAASEAGESGGQDAATEDPDTIPEDFLGESADGWLTLVTGRWELPANTEGYICATFTLPEDVYAGAFRAISPPGTHHTVLTVSDEVHGDDEVFECEAGTNNPRMIAGSGVGTNDFVLPEGVAVRLRKGQQLLLNLHLFNTSDKTLKGLSGTQIKLVPADSVEQTSDVLLAGPLSLEIPQGGPTVQKGQCTIAEDTTIFGLGPHMHQLGIHLKTVAHSSIDGETVMHDDDYSFDQQIVAKLPKSVRMKAGDKVDVECTYMNTTDETVHWGDSSLAEMCFAGLFRFPAGAVDDGGFLCTH